jgi:hypothetical protein
VTSTLSSEPLTWEHLEALYNTLTKPQEPTPPVWWGLPPTQEIFEHVVRCYPDITFVVRPSDKPRLSEWIAKLPNKSDSPG